MTSPLYRTEFTVKLSGFDVHELDDRAHVLFTAQWNDSVLKRMTTKVLCLLIAKSSPVSHLPLDRERDEQKKDEIREMLPRPA